MASRIALTLETTPKRTFASAIDWPGWSRSGKTEPVAIDALTACAERYAIVASAAGDAFPTAGLELDVIETAPGGAGTTFGVPSRVSESDRRPTSAADAARLARLVAAAGSASKRSPPQRRRSSERGRAAEDATARRWSDTSWRRTGTTHARSASE
jgi:hypothetical protein